ncbi:MAG: DUF2142 domain-containing protein [Armatimonadota bacterium]|nr:DUF2142 domain-containing protein [bacterium]
MRLKSTSLNSNRALAAILCVYIALALAYSFADRLKYGPDEPAHFIYIRSLATGFTPPPIANTETHSEASTSSHEGHQPPLYYALMAVPFAVLKAIGTESDTIWRILRLLNIAFGAVWIYFVYRLSLAYFKESNEQSVKHSLATTAFVALIPTSSYMAGVVNNDILIAMLFTWALIPILALFKTGNMSIRSAAFAGLLIGLAILAKAQGLLLIPMLLLAGFLSCRRAKYVNAAALARSIVTALAVIVITSGWWFARCMAIYGTVMPHSLVNPVLNGSMLTLIFFPLEAVRMIWAMTQSFFSYFWLPYWLVKDRLPYQPYATTLSILGAVLFVGLVMRLKRNGDADRRSLCFMMLAPVAVFASWVRYVLVVDCGANLQGRLLLPVAAVIGIATLIGFDGWFRNSKAGKTCLIAVGVIMICANIFVLWSTLVLRMA